VGVAFAAAAAAGDDEAFTGAFEVLDGFAGFGVPDQCSGRHLDADVAAAFSGFLPALAPGTALGPKFALETKGVQRSTVRGAHQDHVAPFSPVAAVRPAPRGVFLPAETDTTVSTVSGLNGYKRFINKFHSDA
jgi:hypothetical protein